MENEKKNINEIENVLVIEGRNPVLEAFRSGKPIDKVFVRMVRFVPSSGRQRSMIQS